jgi:hypothetical protein
MAIAQSTPKHRRSFLVGLTTAFAVPAVVATAPAVAAAMVP